MLSAVEEELLILLNCQLILLDIVAQVLLYSLINQGGSMKNWWRAEMGSDTRDQTEYLFDLFQAYAATVGGNIPAGFGVFDQYDHVARNATWFFSPSAVSLAVRFNDKPCEKPIPTENFGLLAGNQASGQLYFPNQFKPQ